MNRPGNFNVKHGDPNAEDKNYTFPPIWGCWLVMYVCKYVYKCV